MPRRACQRLAVCLLDLAPAEAEDKDPHADDDYSSENGENRRSEVRSRAGDEGKSGSRAHGMCGFSIKATEAFFRILASRYPQVLPRWGLLVPPHEGVEECDEDTEGGAGADNVKDNRSVLVEGHSFFRKCTMTPTGKIHSSCWSNKGMKPVPMIWNVAKSVIRKSE